MLISLESLIGKYSLNIKGVIHIGAHIGQEFNDYKRANINNLMFFEPLKNNYEQLLKNIILSDTVKTYNIALGNIEGVIEMFTEIDNQGMSSSILEPALVLTQYPHIKFNDKETVKIDRLDNIKFNRDIFNMINIDVQGYEMEVFRGSMSTLEYIDIIYTEVNRDEVYKDCAKIDELDNFLGEFNFNRIETTWDGITWGDALYLKNK